MGALAAHDTYHWTPAPHLRIPQRIIGIREGFAAQVFAAHLAYVSLPDIAVFARTGKGVTWKVNPPAAFITTRKVTMEISTSVKPAVWGAIGGAIAAMVVGFAWGGWVTGRTAGQMSDASA
jgi:formaldehyde-activating enzyme involved in methanogenesis